MNRSQFEELISDQAAEMASKMVPADAPQEVFEAHLDLALAAITLRGQDSVDATLRVICERVARTKSWAKCVYVSKERWRAGLRSHEDFVMEAITLSRCEPTPNRKSRLTGLMNVVAYASENGITMTDAIVNRWSTVREGLSSMKKAALEDEDPEALEAILDDVQELAFADFKKKYTKPKHEKAGTATLKTTDHNATVLVAVLNSAGAKERVARMMEGIFHWGLNARIEDSGGDIVVIIGSAPQEKVDREVWEIKEPEQEIEPA
jgi:hypothetical protein